MKLSQEIIEWNKKQIVVKNINQLSLVKVSDAIEMIGSVTRFYNYHYPRINLYLCDGKLKKNRNSNNKTYINLKEIF